MPPNYGPLDDRYIAIEKAFLAGDFICGIGYGVQLILYAKCARHLWIQRKMQGKFFLLGYITLLLSLYSLFLSSGAWLTEDIFINNRNFPGGPWAYFLATQHLSGNIMVLTAGFLLTYLSDLLVLWRCWVVWNSSGKLVALVVTAIPAAALLASFAFGILWVWRSSHFQMVFGTAYFVTSLSGNILLTVLIVFRLALHRRRILSSLPPEYAAPYVSLANIIIESAALYSFFALVYIIAYSVQSPVSTLLLPLALTFQQISGYLIIVRVARGRAWSPNALSDVAPSEPCLTALNFNAPVFSSCVDMDQEPKNIELGGPLSKSTLLASNFSSSTNDVSSTKLKATLNNSGLQPHTEKA